MAYIISSGESSDGIILENDSLTISNGGQATETTVNENGSVRVYGSADNTTVNFFGRLNISAGGIATVTTINSYGSMFISSGGTANSTTVNSSGTMFISSGGLAMDIIENGGYVYVASGAEVTFVPNTMSGLVLSDASATVHSGTIVNNVTIDSGGRLTVYNGGIVDGNIIINGGYFIVSSGVTVNDVAVFSGIGGFYVYSGGIANNIFIGSSGYLGVFNGGKLTGKMVFEKGAVTSMKENSILDFDLSHTTVGAVALVNDLSCVIGRPIYTLTVESTQISGTYNLANGVPVFTDVIAVINTHGEQLGSLMVGQKLETEYANYTLKVTNGCLTVTVDNASFVPQDTDIEAPTAPVGLMPVVDGQNVALLWNESTDDTGVKEYVVKYSLDGEIITAKTTIPHYVLNNADFGSYSWSVQAVDFAGNKSAVTAGNIFTVSNFKTYIVEYSANNFEHVLGLKVSSDAIDSFRLPTGTYQLRTRATNSADWTPIEQPLISLADRSPTLVKSDEDGNADVFFANPVGTWESGYLAQHVGYINDWAGTNEFASVFGKNKIADIFEGSTDANILLMTDDENGDALFVDDIYSDSPDELGLIQARIAQIDEIRAGAGDDIVDMTSQQFEYIGDGLTIRGGEGNDTIWANKGDNFLFGDSGNDRIVGASGNDVIVGGIGNDSMHGGGGNDVFTFCDNWGVDNVEQLATGSVTLWFTSGDESNWNAETLTYTAGDNSVTVFGVTEDNVTLIFGDDDSTQFVMLTAAGAFFDVTTERVFEESGKGMLAAL